MALFVLWCYGSKFLWTVCLIPVVFGAILSSFCENIAEVNTSPAKESQSQATPLLNEENGQFESDVSNSDDLCSIVYPLIINNNKNISETWGGWSDYSYALLSVQHVMVLLLTVHYSKYFFVL